MNLPVYTLLLLLYFSSCVILNHSWAVFADESITLYPVTISTRSLSAATCWVFQKYVHNNGLDYTSIVGKNYYVDWFVIIQICIYLVYIMERM